MHYSVEASPEILDQEPEHVRFGCEDMEANQPKLLPTLTETQLVSYNFDVDENSKIVITHTSSLKNVLESSVVSQDVLHQEPD
jgi:hypothetical protein